MSIDILILFIDNPNLKPYNNTSKFIVEVNYLIENKIEDIQDRIKYLRENILNIKQIKMSLALGLKQGSLSDIERKKTKTVTDRVINDICREYSINENWLRYGNGDIYINDDSISLDDYARKQELNDLEIDIIKAYISLDHETRTKVLDKFKTVFNKHI